MVATPSSVPQQQGRLTHPPTRTHRARTRARAGTRRGLTNNGSRSWEAGGVVEVGPVSFLVALAALVDAIGFVARSQCFAAIMGVAMSKLVELVVGVGVLVDDVVFGDKTTFKPSVEGEGGTQTVLILSSCYAFFLLPSGWDTPHPSRRPRQRCIKRCQVWTCGWARLSAQCFPFFFPFLRPLGCAPYTLVRLLLPPLVHIVEPASRSHVGEERGVSLGAWGVCDVSAMHPCPAVKLARLLSRAGPSEWTGPHRSHVVHGSFTTVFAHAIPTTP